MNDLLRILLNQLDAIGEQHEEIYDSECRDKMGNAVLTGFIRQVDGFLLPQDFGLFSEDANLAVRIALGTYIHEANRSAAALDLKSFFQRLNAFQNVEVRSDVQGSFYDDYFGYLHPDAFNEEGTAIS